MREMAVDKENESQDAAKIQYYISRTEVWKVKEGDLLKL